MDPQKKQEAAEKPSFTPENRNLITQTTEIDIGNILKQISSLGKKIEKHLEEMAEEVLIFTIFFKKNTISFFLSENGTRKTKIP